MNRYRYRVEKTGIDIRDGGSIYKWSEPLKDVFNTKEEAQEFCKEHSIENYIIRKIRLYYTYCAKYKLNEKYEYNLEKVYHVNDSISQGNTLCDTLNQHTEIVIYIHSFEEMPKQKVIDKANKMVEDHINNLRKENERI